VCLGLVRLAILLIPFRRIAPYLGQQQHETPATDTPHLYPTLQDVVRAVAMMSRHTPWESTCLVQAIAGKLMLQQRSISSTLYLGVAKEAEGLAAHAWLRSGSSILTGRAGRQRFTVISTFAKKPDP
jgi:Transglutaminase-like superfamily